MLNNECLFGMCFDYTAFRQMRLWPIGLGKSILVTLRWVRFLLGAPDSNQALLYAGLFYTLKKITEGFAMILFIKRLLCFHHYDYQSDIFRQTECRKCGKYKAD